MGANTKIFVFKAKELIYTGIFVLLGVLFLLLLIFMFLPKQDQSNETEPAMDYIAGIYSSSIHLGGSSLDVKVTVTDDKVTSISLSGLNDAVSTMYPLLEQAVNDINSQLETVNSIEDLTFDSESQYTNTLLKQAIQNAIAKAHAD
ncbi:MAG: hypothetical protein E7253_04760 [Lachnospiraceae bacterium]|nr:hypothetical protein [Lachnospiraceae bacterium]